MPLTKKLSADWRITATCICGTMQRLSVDGGGAMNLEARCPDCNRMIYVHGSVNAIVETYTSWMASEQDTPTKSESAGSETGIDISPDTEIDIGPDTGIDTDTNTTKNDA